MEGKSAIKNVSILFLFFLFGFVSNIVFVNWGKIDLSNIVISQLNKQSVIEEIPPVVEEERCPEVIEEVEKEVDTCPVLVDISGAVNAPGVYCFDEGSSVIDAIKKAKGFLPEVGFKYVAMKINMATLLLDNTKIYIPFENDYDCNLLTFDIPKEIVEIVEPDTEQEGEEEETVECVSINSATQEELDTLDGIGPSTALKIINARPFTKLEDLLNVSGIGEATFNKFKDNICL